MKYLMIFWAAVASAEQAGNEIISASNNFTQLAEKSVSDLLKQVDPSAQSARGSNNANKPQKACYSKIKNPEAKTQKNSPGQLIIFVSSSVPPQALRELFQDASKIGARLVFKGLINNSFKDTYAYFKETEINADIDPDKFETYQVSVVPTFILMDAKGERFDRLQGHVSIAEALTQFKDRGDLKTLAQKFLQALGGIF